MRWLKRWRYRHGHRPLVGSIFYSPTLDWHYAWKDSLSDWKDALSGD